MTLTKDYPLVDFRKVSAWIDLLSNLDGYNQIDVCEWKLNEDLIIHVKEWIIEVEVE